MNNLISLHGEDQTLLLELYKLFPHKKFILSALNEDGTAYTIIGEELTGQNAVWLNKLIDLEITYRITEGEPVEQEGEEE